LVQLGTKRTALVLYCVLLVLPTAVLGGLHWRQLRLDHSNDVASIPRDAEDAARRLMEAVKLRLTRLLDREDLDTESRDLFRRTIEREIATLKRFMEDLRHLVKPKP